MSGPSRMRLDAVERELQTIAERQRPPWDLQRRGAVVELIRHLVSQWAQVLRGQLPLCPQDGSRLATSDAATWVCPQCGGQWTPCLPESGAAAPAAPPALPLSDQAMLDWLEKEWQRHLGTGPAHRASCDVHGGEPLRVVLARYMCPSPGAEE